MFHKDRLKVVKSRYQKLEEPFLNSEKFKNSEELKKSYEKNLNEIIERFIDSEGMNSDLVKAGYPDKLEFISTNAYIDAMKPLSHDFINIVIDWKPRLKYKAGAVSYLRESKDRYDGRVLIPIFDEASSKEKWFICEAIVQNPPKHLNEWVKQTYLDKRFGYSETGLLPLAVAKMFPKDEAREILKQGFDHLYRVTPEALGKIGCPEDISFLEEKLSKSYDAPHVKKDIMKAISKIQKKTKEK